SNSNRSKWGCGCVWRNESGAWRCEYCDRYGDRKIVGGPLGPENTLYYERPIDSQLWKGPFANGTWALKGHYWICGQYAYRRLPPNWSGICYVGYIRPLFFLLPSNEGNHLGIRVYDDLEREKRSVDTSLTKNSGQKWGQDEWPPERIIQHYGPATWNPNELRSGAREPIYNLNHIIRLQERLEIITSQTAEALDLLADRSTQMRNPIFQRSMVLDYLLAEEGGVCGKLNDSNCCLQINDNRQVVRRITPEIRKFAHVPVQKWNGRDFDLFSWLPREPWVEHLMFVILCAFMMLLILPCLIPCVIQLIIRPVNGTQIAI
ncbi:ENR1 protein, partial [Sagittarius serpentarius]|nr:ENR1 protein [Sagittarius serpentarius]